MRYRILSVASVLLACAVIPAAGADGGSGKGSGNGSGKGSGKGEGPAGRELRVLEKFIGSWKGEVTVQPAGGKDSTYAARNTFSWVLDGRFARDEGGDVSCASSNMGMWTYDPALRAYRSWYFLAPGGEVVSFTYDWVEREQAFRGRADLGGGMIMEAADRFLGKDAYEWSLLVKDKDGTVLNRMTGRMKRVP